MSAIGVIHGSGDPIAVTVTAVQPLFELLSELRAVGADPDLDGDLILLTADCVAGLIHMTRSGLAKLRMKGAGPDYIYVGQSPMYPLSRVREYLRVGDCNA